MRLVLAAGIAALVSTSAATAHAKGPRDRRVADVDDDLAPRLFVEGFGALLGGIAGAIVGAGSNNALMLIGGAAVGMPVGVTFAGWLFDAHGSFWWSLLSSVGGCVAGLVALSVGERALDGTAGDGAVAVAVTFSFPIAGAMLGYELSNVPRE